MSDASSDATRLDGFVGDGREKRLVAHTRDGERLEYGDVYVKHAADGYAVSPDPDFRPETTERLSKADLRRVEIDQHHSTCFITTAAGTESELAALRRFRDGALAGSRGGRVLVALYERASPPIARTVAAHPESLTRQVVGWLVSLCAAIAHRREQAGGLRPLLTLVLVALYAVGLTVAAAGHAAIRLRQWKNRAKLSRGW